MRLGTDEWPPYEYSTPNGEITGIATDLLKEVFSRMDAPVASLESFPWARGLKQIEAGRLDVLFSANYDETRLRYVRYPKGDLVLSQWVFFVRSEDRERLTFNSFDDLKDHRIGVVRDYSYTPEFSDFIEKNKSAVVVSSDRANLELLLRGRVDYALCDYLNCLQLVNQDRLEGQIFPLDDKPLANIYLYPMFNRSTVSQEFVDRFDEVLLGLKREARYWDIINRHIK
ncbi:ABC-type transporter, periplasmic subunit family 3 [Desulfovibrio ferrophilus]|uniref:ABC-type transporter, periplasmic subunit family 3 n=1 Tax=Desulfovibrio ferrophilus TaxID=241368 RepID=A0A2Z6AUQ6_9BACT|nr:ABC-type transporter, periplasmic subunit family 3 [Desulfovibrio ferrophilus]